MGRTYISDGLIPGQTLLHYMAFHELMELLTFNQCVFAHPGATQHKALLRTASRLRKQSPPRTDDAVPLASQPVSPRVKGRIALQWWGLAYGDMPQPPLLDDLHAPRIGVLSTVQALCNALCLGDHDLYISETRGRNSGSSSAIAVFSVFTDHDERVEEDTLHLLADIRELLTGIVLPTGTPPRFQTLVRQIVQEHLWIPVHTVQQETRKCRSANPESAS